MRSQSCDVLADWIPCGQLDGHDANRLDGPVERLAELRVPVVNEMSARGQKADICHGHVASHLGHSLFVRMRRDAGDVDSTGSQVYEEHNVRPVPKLGLFEIDHKPTA